MIWLPPDLFTANASSKLRDQMPFVAKQADGGERWVDNNGADYGKPGGVGAVGSDYVPGKQLRVDKMNEAGLYDDYTKKGHRRPGDPHLRVKELDRDGMDAEVIYGILAACGKMKDPLAANEMLRIYNDFMHAFSSTYPDRMIGLACLPYMITNNLNVAAILSDNPECEVIVAGGIVRSRDRGIVGELTIDFIQQFRVDIGLIGISGIEPDGTLRDFDYREVKVARAIIEHSREVWVATDHSKFNRPAMVELARFDDIDMLFTDAPPPPPFPHLLREGGVNCVTCAPEENA
jgi:hypothetical protein